jgi:hypothetical protein
MAVRLLLRHIGEGRFVCASPTDLRLALAKCPTQQAMWHEVREPRSVKQSRWMHALIRKAFDNQRGDRFESPEHLRAYALCAVGHKKTATMPFPADPEMGRALVGFAQQLIAALVGEGSYAFVRRTDSGLAVDVPKTFAFDKLPHKEATRIVQAVADFLVSEDGPVPGATVEQLFGALEDPQ